MTNQPKAAPLFVAVKSAIMRGGVHMGTMVSKTLAKRVANLLNKYPANREGV
jgi:hypothetical protein